MEELVPTSEELMREATLETIAAKRPLEIRGQGTRRGVGRPTSAAAILSSAALSKILYHEPAELVLCAQAGAPLRDIVAQLDAHEQEFAFEPIDHGFFYGEEPGGGTIGGLVAVNASGPRRIKAGAARDHLLGFRCVTGRGDIVKSGGRVMKNVTGYDLSKLVAGSHGTLAILTEVTLKVLPKAETERTILLPAASEAEGLAALRQASGLPFDVSGLALRPALLRGRPTAALRLEGPRISVLTRRDALIAHFRTMAAETLEEGPSRLLWADLRDGGPVRTSPGQVWRISTAPSQGGPVLDAIKAANTPVASYFYDWAGGLLWLCLEEAPNAHAPSVRAALEAAGGHATLMRASSETRASVDVFHPQSGALAALSKRIKQSFDPLSIFNPGRMCADF